MRSLLILSFIGFAACSITASDPGPGPTPDASSKQAVCGEARDCSTDDYGCETYTYEQLPPRCVDICYRHDCCREYDGAWHVVVYDCALPQRDAGIDAPNPPPDAP